MTTEKPTAKKRAVRSLVATPDDLIEGALEEVTLEQVSGGNTSTAPVDKSSNLAGANIEGTHITKASLP